MVCCANPGTLVNRIKVAVETQHRYFHGRFSLLGLCIGKAYTDTECGQRGVDVDQGMSALGLGRVQTDR